MVRDGDDDGDDGNNDDDDGDDDDDDLEKDNGRSPLNWEPSTYRGSGAL